ncbi:hypothetical protein NHX12_027888 [Muraenolepis orangiensis]|uniref:TFIIB-type domain-containing protein n=1 Tax=Muraenolepis orangiensis TaxID=630683 RepID=A0A9Q0IPA4_9TELE|nr:hypothetical protein NHX12_027888 [Muraenolepis orangiensis]
MPPPLVSSCPDCGSSRLLDDDFHAESQLVCQDCGSVVASGARLVADTRDGGSTDVRYCDSTAVSKAPCRNLILGLQRVRALCRVLRLSYEVEELAEVYYRQAYTHSSFLHLSLMKKEALVGCCVLDLEKILEVDIPKSNITHGLEAHSREYKLSSSEVPEPLAERSQDLAQRSLALVELAGDCWVVTGRHPVPIMMAAIFLSWQSLKPTKVRLKYSLNKFCLLSKMPPSKTAVTRVGEIKEVLRTLGKEIPWLGTRDGEPPFEVLRHVEDILQHRHALMRSALRTYQEAQDKAQEGAKEGAQEETLGGAQEETQEGAQEETQEGALGADQPTPEAPDPSELKSATGAPAEGDSAHWGKRRLFAPPCVRNPKVRRVEAETEDVDGDQEISDSEIDSYLRSPQELRDYLQTYKSLQSKDGASGT